MNQTDVAVNGIALHRLVADWASSRPFARRLLPHVMSVAAPQHFLPGREDVFAVITYEAAAVRVAAVLVRYQLLAVDEDLRAWLALVLAVVHDVVSDVLQQGIFSSVSSAANIADELRFVSVESMLN